MLKKERSYRDSAGRELVLTSERAISEDGSGWLLKLDLYTPGLLGRRKRIESRRLEKSGSWSTSAIGFLQAQEELELLQGAGVELELTDLLR